jgi:hypothetical protein
MPSGKQEDPNDVHQEDYMIEKPAKPARKRVSSPKPKTKRRKPDHSEIVERAYFIHLEEAGCDELGNWLRAEHELTAA